MSNSNKAAKATHQTTPQATPTPRNFEAELIEVMKGGSDAEYNKILSIAKFLRDCRDIISKWRLMGLPDKALVAAIEAVANAFESTDDPAKAKTKARKAFNRVMRDAERAAKPKGVNHGK